MVVGTFPVANGRVHLARRGIAPAVGCWSYPGGFLELGESTQEGARRETEEETRLRVERVLAGLAHLCDQHHLVVHGDETATLIRLTSFVSTLIVNRMHTLNYRLEK